MLYGAWKSFDEEGNPWGHTILTKNRDDEESVGKLLMFDFEHTKKESQINLSDPDIAFFKHVEDMNKWFKEKY